MRSIKMVFFFYLYQTQFLKTTINPILKTLDLIKIWGFLFFIECVYNTLML